LEWIRTLVRWLLAGALVYVGVTHFTDAQVFVDIMPPFLSCLDLELVYISGVFEIMCGLGLLMPHTRKAAGWALILLLIAVFPANIHMAINNVPLDGKELSAAARWGRLPFQFVFGWLAYWVSRPSKNDS